MMKSSIRTMPRRREVWMTEVILNVSDLRMWFSTAEFLVMISNAATTQLAAELAVIGVGLRAVNLSQARKRSSRDPGP